MSEHYLKLHFCMFKKSQRKHNSLNFYIYFGIFSIKLQSLHVQNLTKNQNLFYMFKTLKLQKWTILVFFKCLYFFLPNVHHSFWKLERILTLMIRRAKGLELMNFFFITHLNTFGSKMFFILEIMDFQNVALTKSCSYLYDRRHECIIYMI